MKFTPIEDEPKDEKKILHPGNHKFFVKDATEKMSKSGNEMIEVVLDIFHEGDSYWIYDYLLTHNKKSIWRISTFCKSIGMEGAYKTGDLNADSFLGKGGMCITHIQTSDQYGNSAKIKDYLEPEFSDDIPF